MAARAIEIIRDDAETFFSFPATRKSRYSAIVAVSEETFQRWEAARTAFAAVQNEIEELYNAVQALEPEPFEDDSKEEE